MANQYQSQLTGLGAQDYSNGVNQMINAANATGPLAATDQTAGKNLVAIGDAEQQNMQNQLNASQHQFQQQQQYPTQILQFLQQMLTSASGGFTQPSATQYDRLLSGQPDFSTTRRWHSGRRSIRRSLT